MSDTGEVIPTITLNDFQQKFDDLSSQMENAVQNVHKGDQGNPGNGIKSANNQYQLSDSPVTVPTGGWSDTILATTDQLPYLWTKIIFTYDDGTTKEINFVSSRGDTGSQGPIGPVGPQGKQGNGLVVRGKADKEENLPTTGNNQGDGYLVGTDLYIWIDGSWQNMGSITPDLADYVKVADMNNALNAKQDKIGYTPADDSKVVHNSAIDPSVMFKRVLTAADDILTLGAGIYCVWGVPPKNYPTNVYYARVVVKMFSGLGVSTGNTIVEVLDAFNNQMINIYQGYPAAWSGWQVPNSGTMATKSDVSTATANKADDSKVAHLSGANNFGTVPTVNNNPLLLASSLPSDLARTGQDANFTGKLQKSGIDVATTTDVKNAVGTATANMVDSSKPTNFTDKLQQAGSNVITQAKWVESDSDTHAQSSSKGDTEGFYYTGEVD